MVTGLMALEKQLAKQVGMGWAGRVSRCPNGIFVHQRQSHEAFSRTEVKDALNKPHFLGDTWNRSSQIACWNQLVSLCAQLCEDT